LKPLNYLLTTSRSDTPLNDAHNSLGTDAEKDIVVDAPSIEQPPSSAVVVGQDDDDDNDDETVSSAKRKRHSINYNLDDTGYNRVIRGSPHAEPPVKRPRQSQKIRGVIIGVWRDSDQPDDADKHVIYGFIDIHDRLRTRIYGMNRRGEELVANAPTGAGGCWVTFERVIFDQHLQGLTSAEVKEYVKIRSEAETEEERAESDMKVVARAKHNVELQEAMYGTKQVVHRQSRQSLGNRQSLPRQTIHKTPSFQAVNAADIQTPKSSPSNDKPTGVLLGYWADSSEPLEADKHAVFGVLSGTDCFRVKVQKVTRDGRYVDGNFPVGAGAIWLHFEKVVLDPHLASLERAEVKEYCRIRQQDLEHRESEKERKANELKAVQKARAIIAEQKISGRVAPEGPERASPEMELRHSVRSEQRVSSRHQAAAADAAVLQNQKEKAEARERQLDKSRKEVAMAEAALKGSENDIQDAVHMELKNNIKKLNKVWVAQQAATMPGTMSPAPQMEQEVKYHNGIKYERKQTGPFQGKLVSAAQILIIDGEDYVEYRVLTKPSF
jgi:hypothetical protein